MAEKISRSTGEAYLAIAISIFVVVFPVNWWVKLGLMCLVGLLAIDIAFRHPRTINSHWFKRTLLAAVGIAFLAAISYKPIRKQYLDDLKENAHESQLGTQGAKGEESKKDAHGTLPKAAGSLPRKEKRPYVDTPTKEFADVASTFFRNLYTWAAGQKEAPQGPRWGDTTAEEFRQTYAEQCQLIFDEMVARKVIREADYLSDRGQLCKLFPRTLHDVDFIQKSATKLLITAVNMKK